MIDYGLWAECEDEADLQKLKEYFQGLQYTLLTGGKVRLYTGIDNVEVRGLVVGSSRICENGRGIETLKEALEVNELGIFLYSCLRNAPNFHFAHIGWNAEGTTSTYLPECVKVLLDGKNHWNGFECVISHKLYQELGEPTDFWQFREGYWWLKFRGVEYNPLWSSDQNDLRQLCEQLLPDNFDYSKNR